MPGDAAEVRRLWEGKLRNKPVLLDNPHVAPPSAGMLRSASRAQAGPAQRLLSSRARRSLHALPAGGISHEALAPLRRLWSEAAAAALGGGAPPQQALAGLDLHGSELHVAASSCPSRAGLRGTLVMETAATLLLVSPSGATHGAPPPRLRMLDQAAGRPLSPRCGPPLSRSASRSALPAFAEAPRGTCAQWCPSVAAGSPSPPAAGASSSMGMPSLSCPPGCRLLNRLPTSECAARGELKQPVKGFLASPGRPSPEAGCCAAGKPSTHPG